MQHHEVKIAKSQLDVIEVIRRLMIDELCVKLSAAEYELDHTSWESKEERWMHESYVDKLKKDLEELKTAYNPTDNRI